MGICAQTPDLKQYFTRKTATCLSAARQTAFYEVRIMLLQTHPQFKSFSDLFYMMQPDDNFEAEIEYLLNTYFLIVNNNAD